MQLYDLLTVFNRLNLQ